MPLVLFSACASGSDQSKNDQSSSAAKVNQTREQAAAATTSITPVLDVSAFIAEYDAGIEAANVKYKGKKIELTGPYVITHTYKSAEGAFLMLAPTGAESYAGTVVKCLTTENEARKYYVGQQIRAVGTVEGIAPGYTGMIDISNCSGK